MADKHCAAYCGTRNIYDDMVASAKSLIANSDVDKIYFLIEDDEIDGLPDIIECINVSDQQFFKPDGPNMNSHFTYMAMMRIALSKVLPDDVHSILSLDSDLFVIRDCSDIWDLPIDDCYFASTPEWHRSKCGLQYCNFGVVLYNLDAMRDGKADECIEVLNRRRFPWVEQCVGNYLCQGRICEMPAKYNDSYWTTKWQCPDTVIVHYAGEKRDKWIGKAPSLRYRAITWEEALEHHKKHCS